jgi:hypothetical protein
MESTNMNWYGAANLCKLMAGKEMARRLEGSGVSVFVVQPGMTSTDLFRKQVGCLLPLLSPALPLSLPRGVLAMRLLMF